MKTILLAIAFSLGLQAQTVVGVPNSSGGSSSGGGGASNCAGLSDSGPFCSGTSAASLTGTINAARLPSTFSITGPITLSGSGAGLDLFGCGTQTIPASPVNAVGVIGATSCTGQHVFSAPATGASGSGQILQSTGAESSGITPTQWASAGGSTFPLTFVQEAQYGGTTSTATSFTLTFPKTTASSGNTAFLIISSDGSQTMTFPSGWTVDFNQAESSYARLTLLHKTTASDTSAAISATSAFTVAAYFFEVTGSHTLDQSSTSGQAIAYSVVLPGITPTANSVVFGFSASVQGQSGATLVSLATAPVSPLWRLLNVGSTYVAAGGGRVLSGYVMTVPASGSAVTPPALSFPGAVFLSGGGMAYATFSIL